MYNITQPDTAAILQERKVAKVVSTGASLVATCNPGCHLQLVNGIRKHGSDLRVTQPVTLLAEAYRRESASVLAA